MSTSHIQPNLLRRMTVRKILEALLEQGPLSRADLMRETGISAPTVSKAVSDLLDQGLLEEGAAPENAVGRPGRRLQLVSDRATVIGVVLDSHTCHVLPASLDGAIDCSQAISFATAATYDMLLCQVADAVTRLAEQTESVTLGIGISTPGLVDEETQRTLVSANLCLTNGHRPGVDLQAATGITAVCLQENRGLCLAERFYGKARGVDDFAMLNVTTGLGLGVFSAGSLLTGHRGLAGELGHITVDPGGRLCGCGNHGCLETLATDTALAGLLCEQTGQAMSVDEVIRRLRAGELEAPDHLDRVCEYLAIAMAAAINLFNPSTLFVHSRLWTIDDSIMDRVVSMTRRRTLNPSFDACRIEAAAATKQQGAIAAIVHHLTQSVGPRVPK